MAKASTTGGTVRAARVRGLSTLYAVENILRGMKDKGAESVTITRENLELLLVPDAGKFVVEFNMPDGSTI